MAQVELTLRIGRYGEIVKTVAVPISDDLSRDLMEPLEWSDDSFSLILASPSMWGGVGNAITLRKRIFQLRKNASRDLANQIVECLLKMFGDNDKKDGYVINSSNRREHEKS